MRSIGENLQGSIEAKRRDPSVHDSLDGVINSSKARALSVVGVSSGTCE